MCVFNVDRQHLWQSQSVSGTSSNSAHSRWNHKWRRSHWTHSSMDSSPEPGGTTLQQRAVFSIFSQEEVPAFAFFGLLGLSLFLLLCHLFLELSLSPQFFFLPAGWSTRRWWWHRLGNGMRHLTFSFLSRAGLMRTLARTLRDTPAATR